MDQRTIYVAGLLMATGLYASKRGFSIEQWFDNVKRCLESEMDDSEPVFELMERWMDSAGEVSFIVEVLGIKGFPEAGSVQVGARERLKEIIAGEEDELH